MIKSMTRRLNARTAVLITALATISGCSATTDLSGIVPIDLKNSQDVAGAVIDTVQSVIAVGTQGGTTTDSVASVTTTPNTGLFHLTEFSKAALQSILAARAQSPEPSLSGAIVTTTIACDKGDISVEQNQGAGGTVYTLTFNDCVENSLNVTFTGNMTLSNVQITGDLSLPAMPGSLSATFSINTIQAIDRGGSTNLQGVFDYTIASTDGVTVDQSVNGSKLTVTKTDNLSILNTFEFSTTQDTNTSDYSYTALGSLYSTALGGSVTFKTSSPFTGTNLVADSPDHGAMRITGRANTSIMMNVTFLGSVDLGIDTDGNGTVDQTVHTKWAALI